MNILLNSFEHSFRDVRCLCKSEAEDNRQLSSLDFKRISREIYAKILNRKKCSKKDCNYDGVIKEEEKFYCKKHAGDKLCCICERKRKHKHFLSYANEWVCRNCRKSAECSPPNIEMPDIGCNEKRKYLHGSCKKWICRNHLTWYRLK